MYYNVQLYNDLCDYLLNVCVHTSVFLGTGCISCSFTVSSVLRAGRGSCLLASGGTFFLVRSIRSCCDNKSWSTISQGFIKTSIYFSLVHLWMSCYSSQLAWAQGLGQFHSLRSACHWRAGLKRQEQCRPGPLNVEHTRTGERAEYRMFLQASTQSLPILLSAYIPLVPTSQRAQSVWKRNQPHASITTPNNFTFPNIPGGCS